MGSFYTSCIVQNHAERDRITAVPRILVDTGSEHTWIPEALLEQIGIVPEEKLLYMILANGQRVSRHIGFAIVRVGERSTIDEVVFAVEGDLPLLGARTMEGLNLVVDPVEKRLVDRGPIHGIAHCFDILVQNGGTHKVVRRPLFNNRTPVETTRPSPPRSLSPFVLQHV